MSRPSRRCTPVPAEVRQTADLLERRWQLSIIYAALSGALRFSEFAEAVAGMARVPGVSARDLLAAANQLATGARTGADFAAVSDAHRTDHSADRDKRGG